MDNEYEVTQCKLQDPQDIMDWLCKTISSGEVDLVAVYVLWE